MENKKSILFVSNGHGEDIITAQIIQTIFKKTKKDDLNIDVLPIVGEGNRFKDLPVNILGPEVKLPSGGFARNSLTNLLKDLKAGLLSKTYKQVRDLIKSRKEDELSVVVGDIYILLLTGIFKGGKIIFFPTAKSEYIEGHYKIERYLMKKFANLVLPRDEKTKNDLKAHNINTEFYGNLMMDCFNINNIKFDIDYDKIKIGILPGSREEAYDNMLDFLNVIENLEDLTTDQFEFLTAVANNFSLASLKEKLKNTSWDIIDKKDEYIKLQLKSPKGNSRISIIYNGFGDVLDQAKLFMGMAGTANEQAAGMGKPVIIFPGTGAQFTYEFAVDQKRLLGEGVKFVDRDFNKVAYAILELLEDEEEYKKRSNAGKNRMGDRGAADKTAKRVLDYLQKGD
ncbi:MAG TPA: lipid-A-disaccharide synthase-related protein [Halanaerobiales bacterium]|nr:lipid-A-disaccharide synthase-related protein [Halanaerobiales bacterium]